MRSIQQIDVPDAGDTGDSKSWDIAYKRWLRRRGFTEELARIETFANNRKSNKKTNHDETQSVDGER